MKALRVAWVAVFVGACAAPALWLFAAAAAEPPGRASGPASARVAAPASEAQRAARDFYAWYLMELKADRDPIHDDAGLLASRVAPALLRELHTRLESPEGLDADYFIQAQDYADDWLDHVVVVPAARSANGMAMVTVALGADRSPMARRLEVTMVRDDARWKIRRVVALR